MNCNNNLLILFFILISSCSDDTETQLFSEECIECIEYQYPQAFNDTFINLTLEAGEYCLGDYILLMPTGVDYWTNLDQMLLDLLTDAGYCQYLVLNDTIN
ncbi:MAG: hypothetical protein CMD23_02965 [Flavobacteriales bacterium]|nr:hypothetical protein [Flavobacteriales bacterium]|tara:strand:- start:258 stop:560 length:303 start_codon:yes stop_codon:yes gene_type:complete